ncbi:MAG TPA: TonB-dependent receptor [Micropepsaceae bacterium]|nr:TonB-dependent receptor [Micropepsaceae bacterium]
MGQGRLRFTTFMGSASFLTLAGISIANAQMQTAEPAPGNVPEQVLITGSLIHGTAAVGVPVTNLGVQDFTQTGAVTIGDLFRTVPAANVAPGPSAINSNGQQERETRVNIRGLDQTGPRSLLMVDGIRFPPQSDGLCSIDPSIIPALALDRVDILADGASATYGSDAIAGVVNVILKRNFDGAVTLVHYQQPDKGGQQVQASQLWGRTWDGGDLTLTYEFFNEQPVKGSAHSNYTANFTPWGLDNEIPIGASIPGTISVGAPKVNNGAGVSGVGTVCSNCWAVPRGAGANFNGALNSGVGPLAPSSAATFDWASFSANAANLGTNEFDPLHNGQAWEVAAQQHNAFVVTADQRLLPGISLFATGFDNNRRINILTTEDFAQGITNDIKTFGVPTTNPYYPTNAPNNLNVSYDFAHEYQPNEAAYEISWRASGGVNLDLPFAWSGQIYYSRSYEKNKYVQHAVNDNAVNVALGNTVGGITKPAGVPYLNLFCDQTAFTCNSPATIGYISAIRYVGDVVQISERGARFDGPLFDVPAGQIKAAIGGTYESDDIIGFTANNEGSQAGSPATEIDDSQPYNVWAGFAQIDIPIFGDSLNLPLVRKLDLEGSFRHDTYSGTLHGSTDNPKVAFTWLIDDRVGATIRGAWGTSFRFANAGEYSTVLSDNNQDFNIPGQPGIIKLPCAGNAPTPGSTAADLIAAGFTCGSTPGGLVWGGGPHPELRFFTNAATGQVQSREGGTSLAPEKSANYSIGFELAPQFDFLRGLDLQATWYSVKINGTLIGFNGTTAPVLGDASQRFHMVLPSDLGCPVSANATPTTCAPFESMVLAALSDRSSPVSTSTLTNFYWINDGSTVGLGFVHVEGVDWNASYDFDAGDFGAWNTGITGTYYLHRFTQTVPGSAVVDLFHQNISGIGGIAQNGVETLPRMIYRARLGWSNGPYSVTGFLNYQSHYFATSVGTPPNVNFQCTTSGGTVGGGSMPCAISNFTNIEPAWYTIDLSFGYNTGDRPANDYLKNLTIQLVVQNIMGIHSAFQYGATFSGRNVAAYDVLKPNGGRILGLTLLKSW